MTGLCFHNIFSLKVLSIAATYAIIVSEVKRFTYMKQYAIGLDVGSTTIKTAVLDNNDTVIY